MEFITNIRNILMSENKINDFDEESREEDMRNDGQESLEKEWADALHFDKWPPDPEEQPVPPSIPPEALSQSSVPEPPAMPESSQPVAPAPFGGNNGLPDGLANPTESQPAMPSTYLVWSVIATVLCCMVPGIVAIVYSTKVSSRYFARDYEGSKKASEMAQYWIIGSIVLGLVLNTIYFPLMLVSGF